MKFEIQQLTYLRGEATVFVRQLDAGTFVLSESPRLGDVAIRRQVSQPRRLTKDGKPDPSVFAFQMLAASDRARFEVGQVVELA